MPDSAPISSSSCQSSSASVPSDANEFILFSRWVLPMSGPAIEHGAVAIEGTSIKDVCSQSEMRRKYPAQWLEKRVTHLGDAIVMPGLINLHTHLDGSFLRFLNVDSHLFDWVMALMRGRAHWTPDTWWRSTLYGAEQAALSGTSLVVDGSYSGLSARALAQIGLRGVVGLELFGLRDELAPTAWNEWEKRLQALQEQDDPATGGALASGRVRLTVAPHAPYTVCPPLWQKARDWARLHDLPLLAHVAESQCECQWVAGENETVRAFHDFIRSNFAPDKVMREGERSSSQSTGLTPVQHLDRHGLLDRHLLAAHVAHADEADLLLLAQNGCSVAHCPRSNARLGNGRAPFSLMRRLDVTVGLGTDGLASCDDLDLRNEARFALGLHRAADPAFEFGPEDALKAATIESARALSMDDQVGSLAVGKQADLAIFACAEGEFAGANPFRQLIHGQTPLRALLVAGRVVVRDGCLVRAKTRQLAV